MWSRLRQFVAPVPAEPQPKGVAVDGNSLVLLGDGLARLKQLAPKDGETHSTRVWNGTEWSDVEVVPGVHQYPVHTVHLSNGCSVRCAAHHAWVVRRDDRAESVTTDQLRTGDEMFPFLSPPVPAWNCVEPAQRQAAVLLGESCGRSGLKLKRLPPEVTQLSAAEIPWFLQGWLNISKRLLVCEELVGEMLVVMAGAGCAPCRSVLCSNGKLWRVRVPKDMQSRLPPLPESAFCSIPAGPVKVTGLELSGREAMWHVCVPENARGQPVVIGGSLAVAAKRQSSPVADVPEVLVNSHIMSNTQPRATFV